MKRHKTNEDELKELEKIKKELEGHVRKDLKELAGNRGLFGYKQMDMDEVADLLTSNVEGFFLDKSNEYSMELQATWLYNGKRVGTFYTVDLPEGKILTDEYPS